MSLPAGSECTAAAQQAGLSGMVAEQAMGREGICSLVKHGCKDVPGLIVRYTEWDSGNFSRGIIQSLMDWHCVVVQGSR